jgi:hypothetical protein
VSATSGVVPGSVEREGTCSHCLARGRVVEQWFLHASLVTVTCVDRAACFKRTCGAMRDRDDRARQAKALQILRDVRDALRTEGGVAIAREIIDILDAARAQGTS